MGNVLTLLLFVLPLSVDTFAIAAAVGAHRLSAWSRWRVSTIFAIFEGGTPLIGLGLGSSVGQVVGDVAEPLSGGLLILLGSYLWWSDADSDDDDDDDETAKARRLINARGLALIGLALSISLDELAIGFSFGLGTNLATPATLIAVIAIQTLLVSQLGLSLGARISERLRERIERIAPPTLIFLGCYPLAEALIRTSLVPARGAVIVSILVIVLAAIIIYRRFAPPVQTLPVILSGNQRPAFGTSTGRLDQPRSGRHRARRGISSHRGSTSYYAHPAHLRRTEDGYRMSDRHGS